jgi:lipopolysaccharide/colanic/teichoic acid biosynthesis glycosyltransferase
MQLALKRAMDVSGALAGLFILSPLFLVCAVLVRGSSPGPILFRQQRLGRLGEPFLILKFRTMLSDAPDLRNPDGSAFSGSSDPRVTPIGRFLRSTSLDELPQLWNVVRGEMSLIGPRPDQCNQLIHYRPEELEKLRMKPGLSGLAQISGRNAISWECRKALDCQYVRNWSIALDLSILIRTIPLVLFQRGINSSS